MNEINNPKSSVSAIPVKASTAFGEGISPLLRKEVQVYQYNVPENHPMMADIPEKDKHYVFNPDVLVDLIAFIRQSKAGAGLYLSGPTGCGKSSVIRQFCATLNMPLAFAVACRDTTIGELIGGLGLQEGKTYFREGPLLRALRNGYWFLMDEIDLLEPSVATALNLILDGQGYFIPETSHFVKTHSRFRFIATGNTFGAGDSLSYIGTQKMNTALIDRFFKVEVDYPNSDIEKAILDLASPQTQLIHAQIVDFANKVRFSNKQNDSFCAVSISTRVLISWMQYLATYKDFNLSSDTQKYVFDRVVLMSCDNTTKSTINSIYSTIFG